MADIEAAHPMRKDTIFQIMSMTKPVTAIGIMMLAEEGKLALRDPVERYLPEFKNLRVNVNNSYDEDRLGTPEHAITIRDLLTHTAGFTDDAPADIKDYKQLLNVPLDEVVRQLAKSPLRFQPGTQWSYSSAGIEVLGRIIEVCSGQKYQDFITERILRPLKMQDSFFFPPPTKSPASPWSMSTKMERWCAHPSASSAAIPPNTARVPSSPLPAGDFIQPPKTCSISTA
jgi:CubicO group peptidase (beta-lactamase class C family)